MPPKKTQEQFISLANERHNNKYDYSKTIYDGDTVEVIIICPIENHGEFTQRPGNHTNKTRPAGCPKCGDALNADKRRKPADKFIEEAKAIYGDTYIYDEVVYVNTDTNVIIKCKIDGSFLRTPYHHIRRNQGCPKCGIRKNTKARKCTTDKFISKAIAKHGDTYDYSKTVYGDNKDSYVVITCKKHGDFNQPAGCHLQGSGCQKCGRERIENSRRLSLEDFLQRSVEKHGDTYVYENVCYVDKDTPVEILCRIHGEFMQKPHNHMYSGSGCQKCGEIQRILNNTRTVEEFIEMAITIHQDTYNYSKVDYTLSKNWVTIICNIHGDFNQTPVAHLQGHGCMKCAHEKIGQELRLTTEEFIFKACKKHGNIYDYSEVDYITSEDLVKIICGKHGIFSQKPSKHLSGQGCPFCVNKTEGKLKRWLEDKGFDIIHQAKFDWCISDNDKYLPFDFYILSLNLMIELDGNQHFVQVSNWKSPMETQLIDEMKMKLANEKGISVVRIYQPDVWNDTNNWEQALTNAIKKYDEPENVFIGDIYKDIYC
jgi:very-short-patch-repair endonuclease